MPGYHCKQWIEEGEQHDCWTTTEATLTRYLSEDQSLDTLSKAAQSSRKIEHQTLEQAAHSERATAGKRDGGKQLARLRRICLSIPGTAERLSHGEPTFFTPKKAFAMFANDHHSDGHIAVWLPAAEGAQTALIEEAPEIYFRPPYVGANGWVGVELCKVDDQQLGALVREAFRLINLKSTSSRRSKSVPPPSTSRRSSRKEKPGASR